MNAKKWLLIFFIILILFVLLAGLVVIIVDPYFHYHKPLSFLAYNFSYSSERYLNNGIVKNFDYDAIITGTSHNENFQASEFNNLFNCNSVKVPLSGAKFKEIAEQLTIAIQNNDNLKYVLYGMSYADIFENKDAVEYEGYPTYLYDDNLLNDYKYIFSGQAFLLSLKDVVYTLKNNKTTTFDKYAMWDDGTITYSKNALLAKYTKYKRKRKTKKVSNFEPLTSKEKKIVIENISQNLIDIIKSNNDITFYLFLSPYSIIWWDSVSQNGEILKHLEAEEILIDSLLKFDNVKLYSFFNNYELTCNLNNYKNSTHFSKEISSQILKWIKNNEYLITNENKDDYLEKERNFYLNYYYDSIFEN